MRIGKLIQTQRFLRDSGGNFAILFGALCPVLALSAGLAINTSQLFMVKSNLLNALDSAVTSTARGLTTGAIAEEDARKEVEAFLYANGGTGFAESDRIKLEELKVDKAAKTVSANASVTIDLAFPLFGSDPTRTVTAESAAVYSDKRIEVVMMLDVTGSMEPKNGKDKIGDLRKAAANAVDSFLTEQNVRNSRVRVALVPYANSVNVGDLAESTVFVERNRNDRKQAPGMYSPRNVSFGQRDECATERKGAEQYTDAGPDVAMVNRDYFLDRYADESNTRPCPVASVVPLTTDAAKLKRVIKGFVAEGGTAGHIGIQWSWYMLSNKWAPVLKASERPAKMDRRKVAKYAILMTDGEFNLSYFDITHHSQAYNDRGKPATRQAAKDLCSAMKRQGIEIFTVGFHLSEPNAKKTMADCATPDTSSVKHYYETANGEELNAAFQEIAGNIERLALTK